MIIDGLLQLSGSVNPTAGQLVTALGSTLSSNVIDLGIGRDIGAGRQLELVIEILNSLTSGGAATVTFQIVQADDAAMSQNLQVLAQTDAFAYTALTAGKQIPLHWDRAAPYPARRYVAARYVVGTAVLTNATGQFFAAMTTVVQDPQTSYPSGFAVL